MSSGSTTISVTAIRARGAGAAFARAQRPFGPMTRNDRHCLPHANGAGAQALIEAADLGFYAAKRNAWSGPTHLPRNR